MIVQLVISTNTKFSFNFEDTRLRDYEIFNIEPKERVFILKIQTKIGIIGE